MLLGAVSDQDDPSMTVFPAGMSIGAELDVREDLDVFRRLVVVPVCARAGPRHGGKRAGIRNGVRSLWFRLIQGGRAGITGTPVGAARDEEGERADREECENREGSRTQALQKARSLSSRVRARL